MNFFLTTAFVFLLTLASAQPKLIIPHEHLGYEMEYFDSLNNPIKTNIAHGETWTAVYIDSTSFTTKVETLYWDTTQVLTIQSDTISQPKFYLQGVDSISEQGNGTSFHWKDFHSKKPLRWMTSGKTFIILHKQDPNSRMLEKYKYGEIRAREDYFLFEGVPDSIVQKLSISEKNVVHLRWAGDLNGDGEPDFFLQPHSHHETQIFELIMSSKSNGKVKWKRTARFTEWS